MGVFKTEPVHDWSSHAVDALATLALGLREQQPHTSNAIIEQQFPRTRTLYEGAQNTGWMSV
jgi:hypothetical protein